MPRQLAIKINDRIVIKAPCQRETRMVDNFPGRVGNSFVCKKRNTVIFGKVLFIKHNFFIERKSCFNLCCVRK